MTIEEFELSISQVERVINNCRTNFETKRYQDTYDNLLALFKSVKQKYKNFNQKQFDFCRDFILDKIYLGIEFLHYNNVKEVPSHLNSCLEVCLSDWIEDSNFYSIVFSHNCSTLQEFTTWTISDTHLEDINRNCRTSLKLGVEYKHGLIQISQPRFFNDDFLSNIPCYHELGHFVEASFSVCLHLIMSHDFEYIITPTYILKSTGSDEERVKLYHYMQEHFCDLFAAQYIGDLMAKNLQFIAENDDYGSQHPSTDRRIAVVDAFLKNSGSAEDMEIISVLNMGIKAQTKRKNPKRELELKNRQIPLSNDPFTVNKGVKLLDKKEVHTLIAQGWEHFMNVTEFSAKYPDPTKKNYQINKLIQETIALTFFEKKRLSHYAYRLSDLWSK